MNRPEAVKGLPGELSKPEPQKKLAGWGRNPASQVKGENGI